MVLDQRCQREIVAHDIDGLPDHQRCPEADVVAHVVECRAQCAMSDIERLIELFIGEGCAEFHEPCGRPAIMPQQAIEQVHSSPSGDAIRYRSSTGPGISPSRAAAM